MSLDLSFKDLVLNPGIATKIIDFCQTQKTLPPREGKGAFYWDGIIDKLQEIKRSRCYALGACCMMPSGAFITPNPIFAGSVAVISGAAAMYNMGIVYFKAMEVYDLAVACFKEMCEETTELLTERRGSYGTPGVS